MKLTEAKITVNLPDGLSDERLDRLGDQLGDDIEAWLDFKLSALKEDFAEEHGHKGVALTMETEVG